jgi:hypothetical protein
LLRRVEIVIAETVDVLTRGRELVAHEQRRIVRVDAVDPRQQRGVEFARLQGAARSERREVLHRRIVLDVHFDADEMPFVLQHLLLFDLLRAPDRTREPDLERLPVLMAIAVGAHGPASFPAIALS